MTEKAYSTGSEFPALQPGTLRHYSMRFCPYAQRSRIVLYHKNISHETININLRRKPEWYLGDINPIGKVPALQLDDKIVYDSTIVCEYLDEVYPGEKLTPQDPYQRAQDKMFMERSSNVSMGFYKYSKTKTAEDLEILTGGLDVMENELSKRRSNFYGGDKPMMVDFLAWPHVERIFIFGKMLPEPVLKSDKFPLVCQWIEKMMNVPAVKKSMFPIEIHQKMAAAYRKGEEYFDAGLDE